MVNEKEGIQLHPGLCKRMTKQRVEIYKELKARKDHPDVEAILEAVRDRLPGTSVYTVYRNLNAFEEAGLIDRVATWKGRARYDGNVEPHGHYLCESCGYLADIEDEELVIPDLRLENVRYGRIERIAVLLRGVCAKCT